MKEYCSCVICSYKWKRGRNGSHNCASELTKQLVRLRSSQHRLIRAIKIINNHFQSKLEYLEKENDELKRMILEIKGINAVYDLGIEVPINMSVTQPVWEKSETVIDLRNQLMDTINKWRSKQ